MIFDLKKGQTVDQREIIRKLVALQYKRNDAASRAAISACAATISKSSRRIMRTCAWRITFFGDEIEEIVEFDPLTGKKVASLDYVRVYANSHYVTPGPTLKQAMEAIQHELAERLKELVAGGQAARGAAARAAHQFRPGDDRRDRLLRGDRELLPLPHRPPARRAAADPVRISARKRAAVRRREPPDDAARSAAWRAATIAARSRWPNMASACRQLHRQPPAALQRMGRDAPADGLSSRRRPGRGRWSRPAASSPNR